MDQSGFLHSLQRALKLVTDTEEVKKEEGLYELRKILGQKNGQLVDLGYDKVILKELQKLAQFDSGTTLEETLKLLQDYYFSDKNCHDELMETLIYRVARSNDRLTCELCLRSISSLVDSFDEGIAKHSKQLLKLSDLNDITSCIPIICEILTKMKARLPERRACSM